jgi:galactonate dehydratase
MAAAAMPAFAAQPSSAPTIESLEAFRLPVNKRGDWIIIRLKASNGLTGIGDASQSGHDDETIAWLKRLLDLLRGRSVFDIAWFREASRALIAQSPGAHAIVAASAIEHCLWDLAGKTLGVPTYDLFGGKLRDSVRLYANINRSTDPRTPDGFAAMAGRAVAAGFTAVKLAPFDEISLTEITREERDRLTDRGVACAEAVRAAIGLDHDLLIDTHSRFGLEDGLKLAERLKPLNLFWLEEVTPADPPANLAAINRAAPMPTAGGESLLGVAGFYRYIAAGAVDTVMPDVKACGGMLEVRKIAAIAEGAGLKVSPHGPASPVGNLAAAHVSATLPNFSILEFSFGEVPWRADLLEPAERVADGALHLTDAPGFGAQLNEQLLSKIGRPV